MRLYRGGRSEKEAEETDDANLPADWEPGTIIWFDGTRDKAGTRHTDIGLAISPEDVLELARRLLRSDSIESVRARRILFAELATRLREAKAARRQRRKIAIAEAQRLDAAMSKIHNLAVVGESAAGPEHVVRKIASIATTALFDNTGSRRSVP